MASSRDGPLPNTDVARLLREIGDLLELDQANPFRIRAYRNAARVIDGLTEPIAVVDANPETLLEELPGIGEDLAHTIRQLAATGGVALLTRLRRRISPDELELLQIRGLGPKRIRALKSAARRPVGGGSPPRARGGDGAHGARARRPLGGKAPGRALSASNRPAPNAPRHGGALRLAPGGPPARR